MVLLRFEGAADTVDWLLTDPGRISKVRHVLGKVLSEKKQRELSAEILKRLTAVLSILHDPDQMAKIYAFDVIANFVAVPIFLTMFSEPYVMTKMGTILSSIFEMNAVIKKVVSDILTDPKHIQYRKEVENLLVSKLEFKNWKATQCWALHCTDRPKPGSCYCQKHHNAQLHDNEQDPLAINRPPQNCSSGYCDTKKYVPFLLEDRKSEEHPIFWRDCRNPNTKNRIHFLNSNSLSPST